MGGWKGSLGLERRVMSFQDTQALTSLFPEEVLRSICTVSLLTVLPLQLLCSDSDACLFLHRSLRVEVSSFLLISYPP